MSLKVGLDRVKDEYSNFALFTNTSGVSSSYRRNVELLNPKFILAGEHGVFFEFDRGETFLPYRDYFTSKWVYPIYPTFPSEIEDIEGIVVDIQDVGVRAFTYVYNLYEILKFASTNKLKVVVLDRPNPIALSFGSICNTHTILCPNGVPFLYPFTIGELSRYFASMLNYSVDVVPFDCDGVFDFEKFSDVSLNLTTLQSIYLYPALVLLEGLNGVSVGRGTAKPFRVVGTKKNLSYSLLKFLEGLKLKGILFREIVFKPFYDVLEGELLYGVEFYVEDFKALELMRFGFYLFSFFLENGFDFLLDKDSTPFIEKLYPGFTNGIKQVRNFYESELENGLIFNQIVYNNFKIYARRCV